MRRKMSPYKYNHNAYTCKIKGKTVPVGALYGKTDIRVSNKKLFTDVYWMITDKNIYEKTFEYMQDDGEVKTVRTAYVNVSIYVPEIDGWVNYEIRPFIGSGKKMRYNTFYRGLLDNYTTAERESLVNYPKYKGLHQLSYNACIKGECIRKFKGKAIKAGSKSALKAYNKEYANLVEDEPCEYTKYVHTPAEKENMKLEGQKALARWASREVKDYPTIITRVR